VQVLLGDVGARMQQLEVTTANIDALDGQMRALKSQIEEADIEQTVTELVSRQTAYQAAMLATSRVMGLNLADYLR
jgi:flagellar hook-associated protein 3 FlgL